MKSDAFMKAVLFFSWILLAFSSFVTPLQAAEMKEKPALFGQRINNILLSERNETLKELVDGLNNNWSADLMPMLIEAAAFSSSRTVSEALVDVIERNSEQKNIRDSSDFYYWLWNQPENITADYADFKAQLYKKIDPHFARYFAKRQDSARIRLDEIRWGGVVQDGIPPLRQPKMIKASEADYLQDDNIVFGIEVNGDARAYPKRILAWHEMFVDTVGGEEIAGVYCTLCGTVIPYKTNFKQHSFQLGTSGFLYRSNKLMYDQKTQSLWSTVKGEPVLGPLVGKGIKLEHLSVVTTTWQEWTRRHPGTSVLALQTGHQRDYGEGVAYKQYFASDILMFNTPFKDNRLDNKQEVLALRFAAAPNQQLAIDTDFLSKNPVYMNKIGQQGFVVLTDRTGANRVYDNKEIQFVHYDGKDTVIDKKNQKWHLSEQALTAKNGDKLERLPYHRAFWFGWLAAYPKTKLIQ